MIDRHKVSQKLNFMFTSAVVEFPQIDSKFRQQNWCPRIFQRYDGKTYRYYESVDAAADPMYVAMNTPNYTRSIKKINWQQKLSRVNAELASENIRKLQLEQGISSPSPLKEPEGENSPI